MGLARRIATMLVIVFLISLQHSSFDILQSSRFPLRSNAKYWLRTIPNSESMYTTYSANVDTVNAPFEDMQSHFDENKFVERTLEKHIRQCLELDKASTDTLKASLRTTYGINRRSRLVDFPAFDLIKQTPQDIMHVIFEGVAPMELTSIGVKGACGDISIAVASDVELRLWLKLDQTDGVIGTCTINQTHRANPSLDRILAHVDAVHHIGHALHLCLLLWPERLLPQTEEEEKGASGGRGGVKYEYKPSNSYDEPSRKTNKSTVFYNSASTGDATNTFFHLRALFVCIYLYQHMVDEFLKISPFNSVPSQGWSSTCAAEEHQMNTSSVTHIVAISEARRAEPCRVHSAAPPLCARFPPNSAEPVIGSS
ncbi:hypothetical protein F2P81_013143 [Scophthalmus maximus]|uniref:Uncharacterized protein n=1 Tax=Scophthalmus maximus TaxID=52904 RepID=A0A6A4SS22_SCOMX|nr:hypothetical protein F2P81_013143 [Scophthalmus maximus]